MEINSYNNCTTIRLNKSQSKYIYDLITDILNGNQICIDFDILESLQKGLEKSFRYEYFIGDGKDKHFAPNLEVAIRSAHESCTRLDSDKPVPWFIVDRNSSLVVAAGEQRKGKWIRLSEQMIGLINASHI